ncbi:hypothetical protein [Endozoicomonas montiporae]|nr:hypothetical protein [Endozoicomonas montiporae]AMO55503.1 hypothetical protein EZMO1_1312 [Endozoicomonas montiporae CL-33]
MNRSNQTTSYDQPKAAEKPSSEEKRSSGRKSVKQKKTSVREGGTNNYDAPPRRKADSANHPAEEEEPSQLYQNVVFKPEDTHQK